MGLAAADGAEQIQKAISAPCSPGCDRSNGLGVGAGYESGEIRFRTQLDRKGNLVHPGWGSAPVQDQGNAGQAFAQRLAQLPFFVGQGQIALTAG